MWSKNVSFAVPQKNMAYLKAEAIHPIWRKRMSQPPFFVLFFFFLETTFGPHELQGVGHLPP
jgi:hypothetical protein